LGIALGSEVFLNKVLAVSVSVGKPVFERTGLAVGACAGSIKYCKDQESKDTCMVKGVFNKKKDAYDYSYGQAESQNVNFPTSCVEDTKTCCNMPPEVCWWVVSCFWTDDGRCAILKGSKREIHRSPKRTTGDCP
jgi:hypothetical protein